MFWVWYFVVFIGCSGLIVIEGRLCIRILNFFVKCGDFSYDVFFQGDIVFELFFLVYVVIWYLSFFVVDYEIFWMYDVEWCEEEIFDCYVDFGSF